MPRRDQRRRDGSFEYVQLDLPREDDEEQTDPPPTDPAPADA